MLDQDGELNDDSGALFGEDRKISCLAASFGSGGIKRVGHEAVLVIVDFCKECFPEALEAFFLQPALEDGFLDPEAEILADIGDAAQTLGCGDVINDETEHKRIPGRFWVRGMGEKFIPPRVIVIRSRRTVDQGFQERRGSREEEWREAGGVCESELEVERSLLEAGAEGGA